MRSTESAVQKTGVWQAEGSPQAVSVALRAVYDVIDLQEFVQVDDAIRSVRTTVRALRTRLVGRFRHEKPPGCPGGFVRAARTTPRTRRARAASVRPARRTGSRVRP